MARLRIGAQQLGAEGFRLELDGKGGELDVIELAPSGRIHGGYEQDDEAIRLEAIRAHTLAFNELRWGLERGRLALDGPSRLRDVEIDAVIALGEARRHRPAFVGVIRAASVEIALDLRLGHAIVRGVQIVLTDFELYAGRDGEITLRAGRASADTLRLQLGELELVATDVTLPGDSALQGGELRTEELGVGDLDIRVPDVTTFGSSREPQEAPGAGASARSRRPRAFPFLDHLSGKIDADVVTDVTVPILGRRRATHHFRIPVEHGIIDFRALEKNLAFLENLVLDLKLRKDRLVLEKDIPLLPFDNKPIVEWALDPQEIELARQQRVRIRTLLHPRLASSAQAEARTESQPGGRRVELRRLDIANIAVSLRVGGPSALDVAGGRVRLGAPEDLPAIGALRLSGQLSHRTAGEREPGELLLDASEIRAGFERIQVGRRRLDAEALEVVTVDSARLELDGIRPGSVRVRLAGLRLTDLRLSAPETVPTP